MKGWEQKKIISSLKNYLHNVKQKLNKIITLKQLGAE